MNATEPEVEATESDKLRVYHIPAVNFPRLEAEIAKINKRATKLQCEPVTLRVVGKSVTIKHDDLVNLDYEEGFYECTIEGEPPVLEGWTLVAILEPLRNGEMLVREVPGQTCPVSYRTTDMRCDHCQTTRKRNSIYLLHHDIHKYAQVGKQCLSDFLGHVDPEAVVAQAEYMINFAKIMTDAEEERWGFREGPPLVPIQHFVAVVSVLIRQVGWVPKSQATDENTSTALHAWQICVNANDQHVQDFVRRHTICADVADLKLASQAIKWAGEINPDTAGSTYLHDLGAACRQDYVEWKIAGFVASVISAYRKYLEREAAIRQQEEAKRFGKVSEHLGEVKKRFVFEGCKITATRSFTQGIYQKTFVKFVDPNGNVIVWFASGNPEWTEVDTVWNIRGTVVKHDVYQNVKQTVINRVEREGEEDGGDQE